MSAPPAPSTAWSEQVAPDESIRYAQYARQFELLQARAAERARDSHRVRREPLAAASGTLQVLGGLPEFARHGLFARAGDHRAWLRLSSGHMSVASGTNFGIHALSLRVFGVRGQAALGRGQVRSQDFSFIDHEAFAFPGSGELLDFVLAASKGYAHLAQYFLGLYGLTEGPLRLARLVRMATKPFPGYATQIFHSALPMANGPFAVRLRLLPAAGNGEGKSRGGDAVRQFASCLRRHPLQWELQLQYYTDAASTPIEDASVAWPTPYITVARLMLPCQDIESPDGLAFAREAQAAVMDPWLGLAAHRPLGDVQRARRVVFCEAALASAAAAQHHG